MGWFWCPWVCPCRLGSAQLSSAGLGAAQGCSEAAAGGQISHALMPKLLGRRPQHAAPSGAQHPAKATQLPTSLRHRCLGFQASNTAAKIQQGRLGLTDFANIAVLLEGAQDGLYQDEWTDRHVRHFFSFSSAALSFEGLFPAQHDCNRAAPGGSHGWAQPRGQGKALPVSTQAEHRKPWTFPAFLRLVPPPLLFSRKKRRVKGEMLLKKKTRK